MMRLRTKKKTGRIALVMLMLLAIMATSVAPTYADHGDAPTPGQDQATAIGDIYFFLDPADNSRVIIASTAHGFITPQQNANLGFFDPNVRFHYLVENTGDARADLFIDVTFTRQTSRTTPQTATIAFSTGQSFTAPTTISRSATDFTTANGPTDPVPAPPQTVTTDSTTGVKFFAGLVDDPFFFDGPSELCYRNSRIAGTTAPRGTPANPDPSSINPKCFDRKRDSFAGYNILMVALSVPKALLVGNTGATSLGASINMQRRTPVAFAKDGTTLGFGRYVTIDRMGIPAVNTFFIRPLQLKDAYARADPIDDANGKFAGEIVAALKGLQTDDTSIGILAAIAVSKGDMLRLNLNLPNTGQQGGTNPEAAFPNGRRPVDDALDTIITLINSRQPVRPNGEVDGVNANDVPFQNTFPFFAPVNMPFGVSAGAEDRTRN